ncbi:MAG: DUF3800 domain-containing protein [Planctomycetota bacterium]|nr:DUF3800 domain-containing protein [Planctomycetota bacterium]
MSAFRIYVDESGTHSEEWLVIGMLFVPNHGPLHAALAKAKEDRKYFNTSPKKAARYRETHLAEFHSRYDVEVGKAWVDLFIAHNCYYRCAVVDWSIWDSKYFGDPFEPEALKKRRAYKKWAEMLLQSELRLADGLPRFRNAVFYLDRLRLMYGYDALDHLRSRFTAEEYRGSSPYIDTFQHTDSWKDANQCLQLCDLLTGCMYQSLVPSGRKEKIEMTQYLQQTLTVYGIKQLTPGFWKQYAQNTLNKHFPKFSAWFWHPTGKKGRSRRT